MVNCHVQVSNLVNAVPEHRAELWFKSEDDKYERCGEVWLVRLTPTEDNVAQVAVAWKTSVTSGAPVNAQLSSMADFLCMKKVISSTKVPWQDCAYTRDVHTSHRLVRVWGPTDRKMVSKRAYVVSKEDLIASKIM